jgi:integrase
VSLDELVMVIEGNRRLSPRTRTIYVAAVRAWAEFAGASGTGWTPMQAQAWYNALLDTGKKPQTANLQIYALRYTTDHWADMSQEPRRAIFRHVQMLPDDPVEQAALLTHDQGAALASLHRGTSPMDLRNFAIVVLGLQTGMRRMSFVGAELEGLSLPSATLEIPVKGRRRHVVPLSRAAVAAVEPWVRFLAGHGVSTGPLLRTVRRDIPDVTVPAFLQPLTLRGIDQVFARMSRSIKVAGFSSHSFRHTFVTWCREAGVDPAKIAAITGHVSEGSVGGLRSVLANTYTRRAVFGAEAAEAISQPWMFRPGVAVTP